MDFWKKIQRKQNMPVAPSFDDPIDFFKSPRKQGFHKKIKHLFMPTQLLN